MKAVVAAFNQEKALVGAFSVITNLRMELFEALAQEAMDPEQGIGHNRELYTVWNEKTNFMMTAARENFFSSDYFLWLDIGAVRQGGQY